jgi:hypothetical protein
MVADNVQLMLSVVEPVMKVVMISLRAVLSLNLKN